MRARRLSILTLLGLVSALCASAATPVHATNIVYVCGYNLCETSPDGIHVRRLTRDGTRNQVYSHPSQTRDGSRLAFMRGVVMHVQDRGKSRQRVMKFPVDGLLIHPRGRYLLWHVYFDVSQDDSQACRKKLGRKVQPCLLSGNGVPGWGGGVRALLNEDQPPEVGLYEWTTREVRRIRTVARLPKTSGSQLFSRPARSPDGRFVAVSVWIGGTREIRIGLFRAQTGRRVRWVTRGHYDLAPTWSPDGRQLAFRRAPKPGLYDPTPQRTTLWIADRSGDRTQRIVNRAVPQAFWAG